MRNRARRYLSALLLGFPWGTATELHAQPSRADNLKVFQEVSAMPEIAAVPELKAALGNYFLGSGSFQIPRLSRDQPLPSLSRPDHSAIFASQRRLLTTATSGQAPTIIKHIRSDEGVPFPKDGKKLALTEDPSFKGALALNQDLMSGKNLKLKLAAPELPKCTESKTFTVAVPTSEQQEGLPPQASHSTLDVLYLAEEPPTDAAEIFGERTIIHRYTTKEKDFISLYAGLLGIHCLPFRMRQTEQQVFWDTGLNALKNYSNDPNGEGEYHAYIKAKYNIE